MVNLAADDLLAELRAGVDRHEPGRYPVQHATAAFHLGVELLRRGDLGEAVGWLDRAVDLFPPDGLAVEHAKARNMRGVAHRDGLDRDLAARDFARAAELFAAQGHEVEAAASRFNQGLVVRDDGDHDAAILAFSDAFRAFEGADARDHAAAAARELGVTLLGTDRLDEASTALEDAIEQARRAGNRAALGEAANVLGIVHLHRDDAGAARAAFEDAAGAHPRSIRSAAHAMAVSNVALACQRLGLHDHASLAARQALALDDVAPQVAAQARDVLARVGDRADALHGVLAVEGRPRWAGILRAELERVAALSGSAREPHDRHWVAGLATAGDADERTEEWMEVVLEQPPEVFVATIDGTLRAWALLDDDAARRVHDVVVAVMPRFHVPQWMRLTDTFAQRSEALDLHRSW